MGGGKPDGGKKTFSKMIPLNVENEIHGSWMNNLLQSPGRVRRGHVRLVHSFRANKD